MPDTGLQSPSATGEDYNEWLYPTYAYASDDEYARPFGAAEQQDWYNFGFSIPAGATIDGIEILAEGHKTSAGGESTDDIEFSWDGGVNYTTSSKSVTFPDITDTTETAGGAADTWGRSWTVSEFSNANFRVRFTAAGTKGMFVDHIQIRVTYTAGEERLYAGPSLPGLIIV